MKFKFESWILKSQHLFCLFSNQTQVIQNQSVLTGENNNKTNNISWFLFDWNRLLQFIWKSGSKYFWHCFRLNDCFHVQFSDRHLVPLFFPPPSWIYGIISQNDKKMEVIFRRWSEHQGFTSQQVCETTFQRQNHFWFWSFQLLVLTCMGKPEMGRREEDWLTTSGPLSILVWFGSCRDEGQTGWGRTDGCWITSHICRAASLIIFIFCGV